MRPLFDSPITRLSVRPDNPEPDAVTAPRPRGSRRQHTDAKVAQVRRLIEDSVLTYAQIEQRTGVGRASICRWTRDGAWQRPLFAPRATDTVPRTRASAQLRRRTLAARLSALAERYVRELEARAEPDVAKLSEALELMKMAKLAARPKRRWRGEPYRRPKDEGLEPAGGGAADRCWRAPRSRPAGGYRGFHFQPRAGAQRLCVPRPGAPFKVPVNPAEAAG